jgi:hypothetical protein
MNNKVAIFAFNGETMYFVHALLNILDMKAKNYDAKLIIEGNATKQIKELAEPDKPFARIYEKTKGAGLIDCVCQACSAQTGSLESAKEQGLPLCSEMSGHPSIARYIDAGYQILVF